jgi:cation:H+ antiporter
LAEGEESQAMSETEAPRLRARDVVWFSASVLLPVPWMIAYAFDGLGLPFEAIAIVSGLAILGAAFMLSWACEVAERDIPQSLALLVLALVGVLPEYAIDLHFAWMAGKDPTYAGYAVANMTGANRLLIGFGWAAVVLVACWKGQTTQLEVHPRQRLELRFLVWATLYSFLIPLSGSIDLFDAVILLALFVAYVRAAMKGDQEEVDLVGPAMLIDGEFADFGRRAWAVALFLFAAAAIFVSAEPFAESLVHLGHNYDIDEFLLVQWVAPLASESPEFVVAILFALKLRGSVGIGALVSSKVNQWTLLVGAIPIAYAISIGGLEGLPLDERQTEELLLTSAQSLLAAIMLSDLSFSRREALILAALFAAQLFFPSTEARWWFTGVYGMAAVGLLLFGPRAQRDAFLALLIPRWRGAAD